MKIIVCIKQVPSVNEVRIDAATGTLLRQGVPSVINSQDRNALEEALLLKARHGGDVTVVSMGPPQADEALMEALAMGADKAVLLADRLFAGADTIATSYTLGKAIETIGAFDLILCGKETSDGSTAQVGPQLAEYLDLPQISSVRKLNIEGGLLQAERALEDGFQLLETALPALLTVTRSINSPREISVDAIINACREKQVLVWSADDIQADREQLGLNGSPTATAKSYVPEPRSRRGEMLQGPIDQVVAGLCERCV